MPSIHMPLAHCPGVYQGMGTLHSRPGLHKVSRQLESKCLPPQLDTARSSLAKQGSREGHPGREGTAA